MSGADALRDEVALLRRSIDDARDEHERGELDDAGLAAIEARDGARLTDSLDRLAALGAPEAPESDASPAPQGRGDTELGPAAGNAEDGGGRRPRRRRAAIVALCCAVALGAVALALPRSGSSAPVKLDTKGKVQVLLLAAELELARGHLDRALTAYGAVLRLDARNPEGLAEWGWLRYETGLRDHRPGVVDAGIAALRRAIRLAPREAAGHLYLGIALLQHEGDRAGALRELWAAAALPESTIEQSLTAQFIAIAQHRAR